MPESVGTKPEKGETGEIISSSYDKGRKPRERNRDRRDRDTLENDSRGSKDHHRRSKSQKYEEEEKSRLHTDSNLSHKSDAQFPAALQTEEVCHDPNKMISSSRHGFGASGARNEPLRENRSQTTPKKQFTQVVFMTKKERELATKRREDFELREKREKEEREQRARRDFFMQEEISREKERKERLRHREEERRRREEEKQRQEDERKRLEEKRRKEIGSTTQSSLFDLNLLDLPSDELRSRQQIKELEQIRSHYLGITRDKKKLQKPSEKFRNIFNFEWDASEDTLRGDTNPLYQSRIEPQLLFGRGYRAGIDVREQRKHNCFYDKLVKERHAKEAGETNYATNAEFSNAEQFPSGRKQPDESRRPAENAIVKALAIETGDPHSRHWTEKKSEEMTDRDWRIFREDFEIYIKGGRVPAPSRTWSESALSWELITAINKAGYERPTPIQMQAIPIALEMRDLIGIAETGSGKTAAFVLPLLMYVGQLPLLNDETSQDGPYALILAPSRELALQIDEETRKFASFCKCRAVAVVGGRSAEAQGFELRKGAEIVIGTPGRVKDCLDKAYTVLSQCNYVILDEADRMIDLGFQEVVQDILDLIPTTNLKSEDEALALEQEMLAKAGHRRYRVTHMFSATMPPSVEMLAKKYLRAPAYISVGDPGAGKRSIEQKLEFITEGKKKQRLQEILQTAEPPVIVFVNQKKVADVLSKALNKLGFSTVSLHGGKNQQAREDALAMFKKGEVDVLVATDVAGRGIDVEGVQLVLNFDMPSEIEAYTHRIGRTGRAGKKGLAISFVKEEDAPLFYDLKNLFQSTNNIVPMELANHAMAKIKPGQVTVSQKKSQVVFAK